MLAYKRWIIAGKKEVSELIFLVRFEKTRIEIGAVRPYHLLAGRVQRDATESHTQNPRLSRSHVLTILRSYVLTLLRSYAFTLS